MIGERVYLSDIDGWGKVIYAAPDPQGDSWWTVEGSYGTEDGGSCSYSVPRGRTYEDAVSFRDSLIRNGAGSLDGKPYTHWKVTARRAYGLLIDVEGSEVVTVP